MDEFAHSEVLTARQLIQHSGALRALGQCLLRDPAAVEDLVQDTYVAALQRAPRQPDGLRSWLTAIARNLAYRHGRTERRRQRREAVAARPERVPAAGDVAAETELLRRIGSLVHELEEPYRTAVHLRFWHGMTPTQIAGHLAVPFNTVRTRLQRGLEKLRGRLDQQHGQRQAWTAPLLWVMSPGGAAPTVGVVASVITGTLVMKTKWILGGAAVLLLTLGYWISQLPDPAHSGELEQHNPAARLLANEGLDQQSPTDRAGKPPDTARQAVAPAAKHITLSGRCVDSVSSQPVAGCNVGVRGLDAFHRVDPSYTSPIPMLTTTDGRFTIHCDATDARLELLVRARHAVAMSAWWDNLEPGSKVDVGDVSIQSGCVVAGRVVDTAGSPRPDVEISLTSARMGNLRNRNKIAPTGSLSVTSGSNGALEVASPVAAGKWTVRVEPPHYLAKDAPFDVLEIARGETNKFLNLVVRRELATITGTVRDDQSQPVANAMIRGEPTDPRFDIKVHTNAKGRFRLPHIEGTPAGPMRLKASRKGFDTVWTRERYPWGTTDVEIVLSRTRKFPLQLLVVAAGTGAPITDFALRIAPDPRVTHGVLFRDWRRRHAGHHEGGQVSVPIPAGTYLLVVEPEGKEWALSDVTELTMTKDGVPPRRVELHRNVTRVLHVVDLRGEPVDGTRVQLLKPLTSRPVTLVTPTGGIDKLAQLLLLRQQGALQLMEGVTEGGGVLPLVGPPAGNYVARLLGPGHTPVVIPGVVLADGMEPLELVVARGGSIVGRIGPRKALARLQPKAEMKELIDAMKSAGHGGSPDWFPHVWLAPADGTPGRFPEQRSGIRVGMDGVFRIDGVPPGSWKLHFRYSLFPVGGTRITRSAVLETIRDLRVGEVRKLTLDASPLAPGRLRAQVFLDGKPVAERRVTLMRRESGVRADDTVLLFTDAQGRLDLEVPPGRFQVSITASREGKKHRLSSAPSAHIPPGGEVDHVFQLFWSRLKMRIVDADGKPVTDRKFFLSVGRLLRELGIPNAKGELVLDPVPYSEPFHIVTWPRELEDKQKQRDHITARRRAGGKWKDVLIKLGTIQAPLGQEKKTVELRMPR